MPNKPLLLGITGGIGSGKSTVCHVFEVLGIPVYEADERAKWLVAHDPKIQTAIRNVFGDRSFVEGKYNNSYIAAEVFGSKEKLEQLNAIIHPAVGADFKLWIEAKGSQYPYLIKEAALMINTPSAQQLDRILVVHASEALRIKRIKRRDPFRDDNQIRNIIQRQLSQEEMMQKADFLIDNGEQQLLIPQVLLVDNTMRSLLS